MEIMPARMAKCAALKQPGDFLATKNQPVASREASAITVAAVATSQPSRYIIPQVKL